MNVPNNMPSGKPGGGFEY